MNWCPTRIFISEWISISCLHLLHPLCCWKCSPEKNAHYLARRYTNGRIFCFTIFVSWIILNSSHKSCFRVFIRITKQRGLFFFTVNFLLYMKTWNIKIALQVNGIIIIKRFCSRGWFFLAFSKISYTVYVAS